MNSYIIHIEGFSKPSADWDFVHMWLLLFKSLYLRHDYIEIRIWEQYFRQWNLGHRMSKITLTFLIQLQYMLMTARNHGTTCPPKNRISNNLLQVWRSG